jgi:phage gp29-like protein
VIRPTTASVVASIPKIGGDYARFVADRQQTEYLISPGFLGEDEHPSRIIRDKSEAGDRLGEVYDRMLSTDATLAGLWEKRCKAVLGLPWSIIPGDESEEAQQIADATTEMLWGIRNLEVNLAHQLGATARGCAFDELRWEMVKRGRLRGLWAPVELIDRPMWRFAFKLGVLHVRRKDSQLEPVQPGRILHLAHGTKDTPWGDALLDKVWWFYWLSLHAWKYYGVALEKWAQPTVLVPYERSEDSTVNQTTVNLALAVAADIQTEYAAAIPSDLEVKLLEATRGGSVSYDAFLHLLDRAKALFFLGEVDTSGLSQGPGSYAKNTVSNEVRYETILSDAHELENSLTDGLIAPFVRVNYGLDAPMPYWEFDVEEAADRELRQAGVAAVLDRDLPVPRSYYYRVHQVPDPRRGERTIRKARPEPQETPPPREQGNTPTAAHWADVELAA